MKLYYEYIKNKGTFHEEINKVSFDPENHAVFFYESNGKEHNLSKNNLLKQAPKKIIVWDFPHHLIDILKISLGDNYIVMGHADLITDRTYGCIMAVHTGEVIQ